MSGNDLDEEESVSQNRGESPGGSGIVLRHGTVLTMDESRQVLTDADVLVVGDRIAAVGTGLEVPRGTQEIEATGGIVMPGMIDTGVTTTVDWSHGLQTVEHAAAALEALQEVPARFVLAYGNIQAGPWEWTAQPEVRRFLEECKSNADDRLGVQLAFDVTGDPSFPERAAFQVARDLELPVTTHAGVWGATNDDGIRLMHENGYATPQTV